MTDQCFGRLQKDKEPHRGRFGDNHRFFLEYRCSGKVSQEQLCAKCLEWKKRGVKKNDHYRSHHGLITEPIPEWSHIFEGPWYQSKVATYGHPSKEEMARAKEAQQQARKGIETKVDPPVVQEQKPEKPKRGRKKKEAPVPIPPPPRPPTPEPPVPPPSPPPPPPPQPKAPGKRRPKKTAVAPVVAQAPSVQVQAVETSSLPTEVEIVKIVVRPFFANDTMYFRDASKNKLYSVGKDKRPSTYVGRWDPESETIDTEFPDSDVD